MRQGLGSLLRATFMNIVLCIFSAKDISRYICDAGWYPILIIPHLEAGDFSSSKEEMALSPLGKHGQVAALEPLVPDL